MKLMKRLFGGGKTKPGAPAASRPASLETQSEFDSQVEARAPDSGNQSATRRELVRVLARDTLRQCGVPDGWVECQSLVMARSTGQTQILARLVVRHWDERLLRYAMAFEKLLLEELHRFDPDSSEWLQSITWQFKAKDCPVTEMPDPSIWGKGPVLPEPVDEVQEDLARLFAVRDAELASISKGDVVDFQPTQPGR